jgi:hypothetical protein
MIAGGVLFLFGEQQVSDSDDQLLFSDSEQAEMGEESAETGAAVFGTSLMAAGMGLAVLVAGIFMGGKPEGQQQQQQVVVVGADGSYQPPQLRQ